MSQEELAEALGTSKQMVYKYENGKVSASAEAIARISHALKVPTTFFLRDQIEPHPSPLFFRQFKSKTKSKHRTAALRQMAWVQRTVEIVERYLVLPKVNVPDFHPPSDPREITNSQIEEAATALRRHWGLGDGVISDVVKLLESNGCVIVANLVDCETMDGFSQWSAGKRPFLVIDCRTVSSSHRRIDVAHELGHALLHRALDKRFLELNPTTHKLIEDQAFRFAGAFLLPEPTFRRSVPFVSLDRLLLAKPQWKMSVAAMLRRAENLGIIDTDSAKRLWINRNRRGWRDHEPLDEQIAFEKPRMLANALRMMKDTDPSWIGDLCDEVGVYASDVARYAGIESSELIADEMPDFPLSVRDGSGLKLAR